MFFPSGNLHHSSFPGELDDQLPLITLYECGSGLADYLETKAGLRA